MNKNAHPIYNLRFGLLCLSSFLFSASFNMLIPELPAYLSSLGGAEYKGLIIALFTLTAGISRPFSGKLTDQVGRVPIMAVGSVVCVICGFLYPILTSVAGFLFIRLIHGFSTGFKPTATAAYIADIIPSDYWGRAMGLHGLSFSIGMAFGPALGGTIGQYLHINYLFYTSSFLALLSIIILYRLKETLPNTRKFNTEMLRLRRHEIFEWKVLPSVIIVFLGYLNYGVILTLIPDWSGHLGIQNKGLFFMVFTLSSTGMRFFSGRVADQFGRVPVLMVSLLILVVSLLMIGFAPSGFVLLSGAILYGISTGLYSPAVSAWTVDLSRPRHRGKGIATMYIALEAGIGLGALFSGWIFADHFERIPPLFVASAVISALAFAYLVWYRRNHPQGAGVTA